MKPQIPSLGAYAVSLAGHDKGKTYLITKVLDSEFVEVCDGDSHKVAGPKRKRMKHLKPTGARADEKLLIKICEGTVKDNEIHKAILLIDQKLREGGS